jgi:GMP synthase-like glutamine amidotransferase
MENLIKLDLVYLKNEDFNIYKNAHMIFFSFESEKIKFLFLKRYNASEGFSHITTSILPQDNAPTFSVARVLAMNLQSLFNQINLQKMFKQEELTAEDIIEEKDYFHHELWENKVFMEWLENLSEQPIIQYDIIQGHQFYFYEIPNMEKLEKINENLVKLNFKYTLKYFSSEIFNSNNSTHSGNINNSDNNNSLSEINKTTTKFFQSFSAEAHIKETLRLIGENKLSKFYILSIKPAEGTKRDQAGFFNFPALFQGIYRKNKENWIYLVCSLDKLPLEAELENAKAIIIPGSHLSVYNDHDFLRKTEEWVKNFHENHKNVKFLGICFGMQIFMTAMGGTVEKMKYPFVRTPTKIEINQDFWDLEFVKKSGVKKTQSLNIMQAHGDECTFIPDELKIKNYGKSDSCYNEVLVCEDERILLIQGHPEYEPSFNIERIVPYILMREGKEKTLENILEAKKVLYEEMSLVQVNSNEWRMLCNSFMKN